MIRRIDKGDPGPILKAFYELCGRMNDAPIWGFEIRSLLLTYGDFQHTKTGYIADFTFDVGLKDGSLDNMLYPSDDFSPLKEAELVPDVTDADSPIILEGQH